jgi:hypothetical protein
MASRSPADLRFEDLLVGFKRLRGFEVVDLPPALLEPLVDGVLRGGELLRTRVDRRSPSRRPPCLRCAIRVNVAAAPAKRLGRAKRRCFGRGPEDLYEWSSIPGSAITFVAE